ncbi:MAG TPA: SET domain-containing protein [Bacteroidia bacterium]|jgi:SET domain-containing protein|nr:SET domain-containing protein [Bacteroidia bacterium]
MLVVKKSRIKDAGKGLFTTSRIRKGDVIVEYLGERITWKQALRRYKGREEELLYIFEINEQNCIDAHAFPHALAAYANDANGTKHLGGKKHSFRNNCEYDVIKGRPYIVATKDIGPNSEIFVDYGEEYWEAIVESLEKDKKKPKVRK